MMYVSEFAYLASAVCFILSLRGLSSASTAKHGNILGMLGMGGALLTTLFFCKAQCLGLVFLAIGLGGAIGILIAYRIKMVALPQLVAAFHSLIGAAAVMVAGATLYAPQVFHLGMVHHLPLSNRIELGIGALIGAVTFTGSLVAFAKLQNLLKKRLRIDFPIFMTGCSLLTVISLTGFLITGGHLLFWILVLVACLLGAILILPIGGADMPVVVSMLNSYSGWATCATGFTLGHNLLIIVGALVGASGAILSYVMVKNMNRSLLNVIFGSFRKKNSVQKADSQKEERPVKVINAQDAAFLLSNAENIIIVPGYGMAVAQAQHAISELTDLLKDQGIQVRFAIHPVAGRMPGHMNVLLAEAQIPYEDVFELEDINGEFVSADIALVIGANDITNPAAKDDPSSSIYGMPILEVEKAKTVLFLKRSLGGGYAGIDNELFYRENTWMLLGDAKVVCEQMVKSLKN